MKGKRIFTGVCLMGLILLIGLGVVYKVYADNQEIVSPKDFGQGVYYFSVATKINNDPFGVYYKIMDPETFGRSLAAFKARHTNLKVSGMESVNHADGFAIGYWINFEEK